MTDYAYWISLGSTALTIALIALMLFTYRRERRIGTLSLIISVLLSVAMLILFSLLTEARLRPVIAVPLFAFGLLVGVLRSLDTKLYYRDGRIMGRRSAWFLVGWGASLVLAQLLTMLGSVLLASVGLITLVFATGAQVGLNGNLFIQRLRVPKPPGILPEYRNQPAFSALPESSQRPHDVR